MANALVTIANGIEEIEAVAVIDILRRGAVEVTIASVGNYEVRAAHGLRISANCLIDQCQFDQYDVIVLPGGLPGADHLSDSEILIEMLEKQNARQGLIAAICASPAVVLQAAGILTDHKATCYPAFSSQIENYVDNQSVVFDKNIITSQGPGTAFDFALFILAQLEGQETADKIAKEMLVK